MDPISEKTLTRTSGRARVRHGMSNLSTLLNRRVHELELMEGAELSVQKLADRCGLKHWIVRDALRGDSRRPRPEHLTALARGLGLDEEQVVLVANGVRKLPAPAS